MKQSLILYRVLTATTLVACGPTTTAPSRPPARPSPAPASRTEGTPTPPSADAGSPGTFGDDVAFLQKHTEVILLSGRDGQAQVAVAPDYQGRVMTSTARGPEGTSFGWINRSVVAKHAPEPHMTALGGEDRFWLGPEGGQFGLYFAPGAPFDFEHWQVPEPIDWGAFRVTSQTDTSVSFQRRFSLQNHAGTEFHIEVRRTVQLLDDEAIAEHLGGAPGPGTSAVGYESVNVITNKGRAPWTKETGLVSIWILGMFTPSPETVIVLPVQKPKAGTVVRDDYFGKVPSDRLRLVGSTVFFKGDGLERGKIGIPPAHAVPVAGSFDDARDVLTIVQFSMPSAPAPYVDSRWEMQTDPYAGDVTNSYNDGPPEPGKAPMGPFYEIESSSPAAALEPDRSLEHVHRTIHLQGPENELDAVAQTQLSVGLEAIRGAFEDGASDTGK